MRKIREEVYGLRWLHTFCTCDEEWTKLRNEALGNTLSAEEDSEVNRLIAQYQQLYAEIELLKHDNAMCKEYGDRLRKELFPLQDRIAEYWKQHGYSDLLIREGDKVGMMKMEGGVAIHPVYDDICLTYDGQEFFFQTDFVVKRNGKWGLVNQRQEVLIPFEYDCIYRKPHTTDAYIVEKNGRKGVMNKEYPDCMVREVVKCEMDTIYDVPGWDIVLFTKDGKWGWWWSGDDKFYRSYHDAEYDEVFIQPIEDVRQMDDEDETFFVRKGDNFEEVLYWTIK